MVTDIHDGGRQPGDEQTTGTEVIPFRRTRAMSREDESDSLETAHAAFGAQLAALSVVPGQGPRTGSSGVAAAIATEIRARREGLAADELRVRDFPRSRQVLTKRQRQMEVAFINGALLALTHALGRPYDITSAEQMISNGAGQ
jgi:hypothetical protein